MSIFLILFACGGASPTPPSAAAEGSPVVTWEGGSLTLTQIEERIGGRLASMEQEYQLERHALLKRSMDAAIDDALLKAEAKRRDLPEVETLLREEIEKKVQPPGEPELRAFYEEVKPQLKGAPFEQVAMMLGNELIQRQMGQRYEAFVKELRAAAKVEGGVPYPELKRVDIPVESTDPVLGAADAPVTIVQFAEYQCYYCGKVQPTLDNLLADYKGKVKLVYKDFPLENHTRALPAAVAARCAGEQDQYWEMSRLLLADQQALSEADFTRHAQALELNEKDFAACLTSGTMEPRVQAGFELGKTSGISATPTFYVNGILLSGAQPYDAFKELIDKELKN